MSTHDGQSAEGAGISFREAEDYVEQRRQKEILDAASKVKEIDQVTDEQYEYGEIDLGTRRAILRTAVKGLILEVEQLARRSGAVGLLANEELYTVKLHPPNELVEFVNNTDNKIWGEANLEPRGVYDVEGIRGYLDAPETFSETWTIQADIPHEGPKQVSRTTTQRMPVGASGKVYQRIKRFLSEVGLDLNAKLEDYKGGKEPGL